MTTYIIVLLGVVALLVVFRSVASKRRKRRQQKEDAQRVVRIVDMLKRSTDAFSRLRVAAEEAVKRIDAAYKAIEDTMKNQEECLVCHEIPPFCDCRG
jgi:flagellar biosynthesis/type III secretory pathway M-ring protein FliF/YscJ